MSKGVTMKDIATSLGISKATVSFAFNDPSKIKSETYERIMAKARELEYLPNPAAKRLSMGKNYIIGFLLPQNIEISLSNPYTIEVLKGIAAEAEKRGYSVNLIPPLKSSVADAISMAAVDGIISMGIKIDGDIKETLRRRHIPICSIDGRKSDRVNSINIDDEKAAYEQMKYVLSKGHKKIIIMALGRDDYDKDDKIDNDSTGSKRLKGYERALKESSLSLADCHIVSTPPSVDDGYQAFESAYEEYKATAIVSMSDAVSFGILKRAREMNLKVPEDLSIIGFDGLMSGLYGINLTTIVQPAYQKGVNACSLLFSSMDDDDEQQEKLLYVDYSLYEGESVKDLRV